MQAGLCFVPILVSWFTDFNIKIWLWKWVSCIRVLWWCILLKWKPIYNYLLKSSWLSLNILCYILNCSLFESLWCWRNVHLDVKTIYFALLNRRRVFQFVPKYPPFFGCLFILITLFYWNHMDLRKINFWTLRNLIPLRCIAARASLA